MTTHHENDNGTTRHNEERGDAIAHHSKSRRRSSRELGLHWLRTLRWHLLLLYMSDLGRDIVARKYDAFTTDRAYDPRASGRWLVGKWVDAIVRRMDTQVALRDRLAIVTEMLADTTARMRETTGRWVDVVSGPCGLVRDVCQAWTELVRQDRRPEQWLRVTGLDLDDAGDVLLEAGRRASAAGVLITLAQADLLDGQSLSERFRDRTVDVFHSMGLTTWLDDDARAQFLSNAHRVLRRGGELIVDIFRPHSGARYVDALEMSAWYPEPGVFEAQLAAAGFEIVETRESRNGVVVVHRAIAAGPDTVTATG